MCVIIVSVSVRHAKISEFVGKNQPRLVIRQALAK